MPSTTCIECGTVIPKGPRCQLHRRDYGSQHRKRRRVLIEREPWCHYPGGCHYNDVGSYRNPLTREHLPNGGDTVLCHRHNSARR